MEKNDEKKIASVESFNKFSKVMKELIDNKSIKINFSPFAVEEWIEDEFSHINFLNKKLGINNKEISQCRNEFFTLLFFRLKFKKDYLEMLPEKRKDFNKKIKILENVIIDNKIEDQYNFQVQSRGNIFEHLDWEIVEHKGKGEQRPITSARILIKIRNPTVEDIPGKSQEFFTFNCNKDDIDEMMKELKDIKRLL